MCEAVARTVDRFLEREWVAVEEGEAVLILTAVDVAGGGVLSVSECVSVCGDYD